MSEEYLKFVIDHKEVLDREYPQRLTRNESELLQLLVKLKIGGFENIVKLYRNCIK